MKPTIGLVFATRNAIQPAVEAFALYAPQVEVAIFVDEGLLPAARKQGRVTAAILRRFASLVARAEESEVQGILFSCSIFSPYLSVLEPLYSVPLMSVDSAMIREAAAVDGRVAVIATVEQAEELTVRQLAEEARRAGRQVSVTSVAVPQAFAVLAADPEEHDRLILEAARTLDQGADRFVLAQISMARAAPLVAMLGKPVLTSMESSVKAMLGKLAASVRV